MSVPVQGGSYIDLKNTTFILEDGYTKVGAVNNALGYAKSSTSIVVDGFTGDIDAGVPLFFTGDTNRYYVVSTTLTTGNATTIVITPGLVVAVVDDQVITVGPHQLEIKVGEGNLTYQESKPREYKLNRGIIDKVRNADQVPMDVNTTFAWTYIGSASGDTVPTVEEFIKRKGPAAAYVSTGESCDPYAVNLIVVNAPPVCTGESYPVEVITFPEFRYEQLQHDAKAGTVQFSGKCNATEAITERRATY